MTAHILDVTEAEYHADPCATPSLSSSIAHILVSRSPAHAWEAHPRLGGKGRPADDEEESDDNTVEREQGTAVHSMLLGRGAEIVMVDAKDWRTNAAKEARETARERGQVPMLAHKLTRLSRTVGRLRANLERKGIVLDRDRAEIVIEWTDETPAGPVLCRSMIDHVSADWTTITDIKTCRSAHPAAIAKSILTWGYDIQHCAYVRAVETLKPELAGRVKMRFAFLETVAPFSVVSVTLDAAFREYGRRRWERAVLTWGACLAANVWPSYGDQQVTVPAWALAAEEEGTT